MQQGAAVKAPVEDGFCISVGTIYYHTEQSQVRVWISCHIAAFFVGENADYIEISKLTLGQFFVDKTFCKSPKKFSPLRYMCYFYQLYKHNAQAKLVHNVFHVCLFVCLYFCTYNVHACDRLFFSRLDNCFVSYYE